jgi:hypothetical protein
MSNISERIFQNAEIPFEIRKVFANAGEPPEEFRGQVMLWRECVARAIMDALGHTGQSEPDRHNAILLDAQQWFTEGTEVAEVFENAGLPLGITRECVIQNFALTKKRLPATGESKRKRKSNVKARKIDRPKRDRSRKRVSGTRREV